MDTKSHKLGCLNVEGKDPNSTDGEAPQESKHQGVGLHCVWKQVRIGII